MPKKNHREVAEQAARTLREDGADAAADLVNALPDDEFAAGLTGVIAAAMNYNPDDDDPDDDDPADDTDGDTGGG